MSDDRILTKTLDLSTVFNFRVPWLVYGIAVDSFTGTPANVAIHSNADQYDMAGSEMIRQKKKIVRAHPTQFFIVNMVAQEGKTLVLRYLLRFEEIDVGIMAGQLTNIAGSAINPATEDKQDDLHSLIGEVQAAPTQYTLLDRLKAVWLSLGEVQESPTQYTLLDRLKALLTAFNAAPATAPLLYNVTITDANTEYFQALPSNTKKVALHLRDYSAFRVAFVTGKVAAPTAPFLTFPANGEYYAEDLDLTGATLYVASPGDTKVAEIEVWT